jgi:predicted DNA-binding transcriptional regulator AlpA
MREVRRKEPNVAEFLSVDELAARYKTDAHTIYNMRYRGDAPPAIKVGRALRFRLEDVEAWELARRDNGGTRSTAA